MEVVPADERTVAVEVDADFPACPPAARAHGAHVERLGECLRTSSSRPQRPCAIETRTSAEVALASEATAGRGLAGRGRHERAPSLDIYALHLCCIVRRAGSGPVCVANLSGP